MDTCMQNLFQCRKCKILELGKSTKRLSCHYSVRNNMIMKAMKEKDLGVLKQFSLPPEKHKMDSFRETDKLLTDKRVAFHKISDDMVKNLIDSMISIGLEYAAVLWSSQN